MNKKWINEPIDYAENNNGVTINAGKETDYFRDPTSDFTIGNAPILVQEADKEFTYSCNVKPEFKNTYDAGAIMVYVNDEKWIKFAMEYTDLGYSSIVSVVTDGVSDDSNGETVSDDNVWLKVSRKDNIVGLYFSNDSQVWKMVRLLRYNFPKNERVYIGVEAQSPTGDGSEITFKQIEYTNVSVEDFRKGV